MGLKDYRPTREVEIDGETVVVHGMTVGQTEELAEQTDEKDPAALFQRRVVAMTAHMDGERLFADPDEVKDIDRGVMVQLFVVACDLSGLNDTATEEAEKN